MYQLKQKSTHGKVLLGTKVKSLEYIDIYKKCQQYNRPY